MKTCQGPTWAKIGWNGLAYVWYNLKKLPYSIYIVRKEVNIDYWRIEKAVIGLLVKSNKQKYFVLSLGQQGNEYNVYKLFSDFHGSLNRESREITLLNAKRGISNLCQQLRYGNIYLILQKSNCFKAYGLLKTTIGSK